MTPDKAGAVLEVFVQSSVHGDLGTNLIGRFLLRNSALRHR